MSRMPRVLLVAAFALAGLASAGCADLTRPDEITILAEPPPAPMAAAPLAAAAVAPDDDDGGAARPKKKAGG